ncbi:MAG: hypothetical protein J6V44_00095 [Methanobrevibacter sp.]|nr:hypothetical protein [Methanobrevibacter sp.]
MSFYNSAALKGGAFSGLKLGKKIKGGWDVTRPIDDALRPGDNRFLTDLVRSPYFQNRYGRLFPNDPSMVEFVRNIFRYDTFLVRDDSTGARGLKDRVCTSRELRNAWNYLRRKIHVGRNVRPPAPRRRLMDRPARINHTADSRAYLSNPAVGWVGSSGWDPNNYRWTRRFKYLYNPSANRQLGVALPPVIPAPLPPVIADSVDSVPNSVENYSDDIVASANNASPSANIVYSDDVSLSDDDFGNLRRRSRTRSRDL